MILFNIAIGALGVNLIQYGAKCLEERKEKIVNEEIYVTENEIVNQVISEETIVENMENDVVGYLVNSQNEEIREEWTEYENCTVEVIDEKGFLHVSPTDYGHMYEVKKGFRFETTGKIYTDDQNVIWYEVYII